MHPRPFSLLLLILCAAPASSAMAQRAPSPGAGKVAHATRLSGAAPEIDGRLGDAAWSEAQAISDFIQKEPNEGTTPSERTEVRLLYDDDALYVGARMFHADPRAIRRDVTRRDGESNAEQLMVSLDTYLDRRTGYSFAVSSGGVRRDVYHSQDSEGGEAQFDPVWVARVHLDSAGWSAEMRIPFSQLRFSAKADQVWGLEIKRAIPERNETIYWVLIPKAATGYPSQFGTLRGVSGIRPSRRLELLPYSAGDLTFRANQDPLNPFNDRTRGRVGGDLKVGLGPNMTLDATVNPDFGQVEADPAVVNLTAFETVFDERRPFFTEGNELLVGRGLSFLGRPTYLYSRRVGAPPHGTVGGDFTSVPGSTTILGATKVTGRLASGLSIGALAAVTPRENARGYNTALNQFTTVEVEPPSGYGVVRLQQEFGREKSTVGGTVTGVNRSFGSGPMNVILAGRAISGGGDWRFRFNRGKYEFTGFAGFSRIEGDTAALRRVQRTSAHYFQRPDQPHLRYDPTRTSLSGYTMSARGDKNAGRFTVWGISAQVRSPGFEINDLGQMRRADQVVFGGDFQLRDTKPHKRLRYWQVGHNFSQSFNFGWKRQPLSVSQNIQLIFPNFWRFTYRTSITIRAVSDELTRGGPLMGTPRLWGGQSTLNGRDGGGYTWNGRVTWGWDELGAWNYEVSAGLTLRLKSRWQATITPRYNQSVDRRQYVTTLGGGPAVTYNSRYVFAAIERSTIAAQVRINYAFTPDLTLEAYAEPFAASGRYYDFGELSAPQSRNLLYYGGSTSPSDPGVTAAGTTISRNAANGYVATTGGAPFTVVATDPDFNRLSFRSNIVLRWEWARGSTFFLIWQQNRRASVAIGDRVRPGSLWDATTAAGDNFLAVKITYWIAAR